MRRWCRRASHGWCRRHRSYGASSLPGRGPLSADQVAIHTRATPGRPLQVRFRLVTRQAAEAGVQAMASVTPGTRCSNPRLHPITPAGAAPSRWTMLAIQPFTQDVVYRLSIPPWGGEATPMPEAA